MPQLRSFSNAGVELSDAQCGCSARKRGRASSEVQMAQTKRGRAQDRKRVAGGQEHEVRYEADNTGKSTGAVKP
jgi:hypothetical protein